ncbi:MAG: hypothetical protein ACOCVW_02505, partial [bacterium]
MGYQGFAKRIPAAHASIRIDVVATRAEGQTMLVLTATDDTGASETFLYQLPWHDALYREIASVLGFFDAVLGASADPPEANVAFFQDFQTDFIATGDLPAGSVVQPYSLASRDGNLLVASGNFVLETDRYFREQAKVGVGNDVAGYWAMHAGATPAGTIAAAQRDRRGRPRERIGL